MRPRLIPAAICLVSLFSLAGTALAKPKVAVLGLEVIGEGATDQKTVAAAKAVTKELRREANRPSGPFELAPNSNKDLLEIKMLSDCSDEGRRCMSDVGKQLGAERLIYGKLERKRGSYEVTLKLLNTETTELESQTDGVIPFGDVGQAGGLGRHARSLYGKLTGAPDEGVVSITANAERGTVLVDDEIRTSLSAGSARVSGLSSGRHTIAIEADGFERWETEIEIEPGATESIDASLIAFDDRGGEDGEERPGRGWRIAFWSGVLVTGAAGAAWTYTGLSVLDAQDELNAATEATMRAPTADEDRNPRDGKFDNACTAATLADVAAVQEACDRGQSRRDLVNFVLIPTTVAAAVFSAFAFYKGYVDADSSTVERRAGRERRRSRPSIVVTPAIGPDLVGAGLELQF